MDKLKEIVAYCAANIVDWDLKVEMALRMIDPGFRNEIEDKVSEWCEDNDIALDFFEDWDKIVEEIIMYKS